MGRALPLDSMLASYAEDAPESTDELRARAEVRRGYPRYNTECAVIVSVDEDAVQMRGLTINVSRGGALVRLPRGVEVGTRCLLRFVAEYSPLDTSPPTCPHCQQLFPQTFIPRQAIWGVARRAGDGAQGAAVAFEFDGLLEVIEEG